MFRIFAFLPLFFLFSPGALASTDLLQRQLEKSYYNQDGITDYFEGECPGNIYRLLRHLDRQGLVTDAFEVVFLHRRDENQKLKAIWPARSRGFTGDGWTFHVVLHADGWILDLDYSHQPTMVRPRDYFEWMFTGGREKNEQMLVKVISGPQYLRDFAVKYAQPPGAFLNKRTDSEFPPRPAKEYFR